MESPSISSSSEEMQSWIETQELLKKRLITEDDFSWRFKLEEEKDKEISLRYVGGVDVSYPKIDDRSPVCGSLVVVDLLSFEVVYFDSTFVTVNVPYIPGFLAFREAPIFLQLLESMKKNCSQFYPQLLMVDGNGLLHPRGFGLACHLGVLSNLPTIGIGKNLHFVDGLSRSKVREDLENGANEGKDAVKLRGDSGAVWGAALLSAKNTINPIFVSVGHRISLDTSIEITKMLCKYRVPEPIRQADIKSREHLRKKRGCN